MRDRLARVQTQLGARLPLVTTEVRIAAQTWRVTAVENQDALLEAADSLEHFPYGFLLWESAVGLSRHLTAHPLLVEGKRVLELGAGVGLPGLVARALGAEVWQTDHQAGALLLAETNAEQNGVTGLHRFVADWRTWTHLEKYDLILGADILYERAMRFYLDPIFRNNLAPGGCLLLSDPGRPQAIEFAGQMESAGWHIALETDVVTLDESDADRKPVEVALLTCTR